MSKEVRAMSFSDWTDSDLTRLVLQAKHAYDTRQLKNCLTYTNLLLQADPDNAEGRALSAAIRYEIEQDLNKARELLANPHLQDQPEVFGRGAEIIIKRVLHLDPDNQDAKSLAGMLHITPVVKTPPVVPPVEPETFVVAPTPAPTPKKSGQFPSKYVPIAAAGLLIVAITGVMAFNRGSSTTVQPAQAAAPTIMPPIASQFEPRYPAPASTVSESKLQPLQASNPSVAVTQNERTVPPQSSAATPATPQTVQTAQLAPPVAVAAGARPATTRGAVTVPGTLAVSSRTSADIYEGDRFLGSTPTTLELSPGSHTLEYRHDDLRSVVTHVIKPGETTNAMIAFEAAVRINAKPWANVFIQGAERRSLGQTPLSEVRVPVGGTLVFENPNFTTKYYRVTGKETAIQMVFP